MFDSLPAIPCIIFPNVWKTYYLDNFIIKKEEGVRYFFN